MRHPVASIERRTLLPNVWDLLVVVLAVGVCVALADGAREAIHESLLQLEQTALSLDPWGLPEYALRTTLRMFIALVFSLVFTPDLRRRSPAKSRRAELMLVPTLDILQSVPILGFLSFTVAGLHGLVSGQPGRRRMRRDLRDLHQPGLEHDVQLLPVAAHRAAPI